MPKVSPEHRSARRRQILDAATRCFAAQGFHATSMQDVFREAGLSAGAVYRYFPSKTALVRAIATDVLQGIARDLDAAIARRPPPDLAGVVAEILTSRLAEDGSLTPLRPLILQVWAESVRDPELRAFVQGGYREVLGRIERLVEREVAAGTLPAAIDSRAAARVVFAGALGYIVQLAVLGDVGATHIREAVSAVVAGLGERPPRRTPSA